MVWNDSETDFKIARICSDWIPFRNFRQEKLQMILNFFVSLTFLLISTNKVKSAITQNTNELIILCIPGRSCEKELNPNESEPLRTNLKNFLNLVRCNLVKNQQDSIRTNPSVNWSKPNFQSESFRPWIYQIKVSDWTGMNQTDS